MTSYQAIAESNSFIVLDKYTPNWQVGEAYQSEYDLEREFIQDLRNQGYEYVVDLNTPDKLLANVRTQLQALNQVQFSDAEWQRFVVEYLDKAGETLLDKTHKIHHDDRYDFVFDDGRIQNIYLVDKHNIARNKVQVIKQFQQTGRQHNRYDVTILVNGLPLVQVELKKRGVAIREAFNQVHRYSKESFNSERSLFKYLQIFVISNGTDSRYFANTTKRDKNSFDFTMHWAKSDNTLIKDLKDFTATFFQKNTLLNVLFRYCVFDTTQTLLIMRPYQIAATERILWKINSAYQAKQWNTLKSGGYIWHTTGSGKTLTSFKAARLATELPFIDKVFFVVDRKDLDYQTMKEYQRFSPDSVNGSDSTAGLKRNLEKTDNKIIVTTIQKLNNLMKSEPNLPVYQQQVVFIFDEAHRSQFGEAQKNLKQKFKKFYQFGFTGTPIFPENALGAETTKAENILQNYDEFIALKAAQSVDFSNAQQVEEFKSLHHLDDETMDKLRLIQLPPERTVQDYRSTYNDIRDWLNHEKSANENASSTLDWADVVFEVDLLKSQEINLDYILELVFEKHKKLKDKDSLVEEARRVIRASLGNRAKESLLVDFIHQTDLDNIHDKAGIIEAFFTFAQTEQRREAEALIQTENLNPEAAKRYIRTSLKREYASENGTELNEILPKMSPLNPQYLTKKQTVFQKISAFIEKFKGVGGSL